MSRRGIHPLLMGLDSPQREPKKTKSGLFPRRVDETSGLESAQRKRYLRSQLEVSDAVPDAG